MPPKANHIKDVKPIQLKQAAAVLMKRRKIATKGEMAEKIKVTPYYYSKVINGETPLTQAFLEKFLKYARAGSVNEILASKKPPKNMYETIAEGLQSYMEARKVTQAELAQHLKTDQQILSRILHCKKKLFSPDMLLEILRLVKYKI
jgi:transcriptional regulator with XRE-family HTH domain